MEKGNVMAGITDKKLWITVGLSAALGALAYVKLSDMRHKGPLRRACKHALDKGEFDDLIDWVSQKYREEAQVLFDKTVRVRTLSDEAKEIADQNFIDKMLAYGGA